MDIYDFLRIYDFYDYVHILHIYDVQHIHDYIDILGTFIEMYSYFPYPPTCSGPGFSGSFQTPSKRPNTYINQMSFCLTRLPA